MAPRALTDEQLQCKSWFSDFISSSAGKRTNERIDKLVREGKQRLVVNMADIREFGGADKIEQQCRKNPNAYLPYWELALQEIVDKKAASELLKQPLHLTYRIGIEGALGPARVTPRTLRANFMGQLVMVDGIVTKCSAVKPKLHESVHYSEAKNTFLQREYRDELSPFLDATHLPTVNVYPKRDEDGNPLRTEFGLCTFTDFQTVVLQEMPESAPVGQLPRSVDVILEEDLVDSMKPGDRVCVSGVYLAYTSKGPADEGTAFHTVLVANNVVQLGKTLKEPQLTRPQRDALVKFPQRKTPEVLLDELAGGIAPAVFGLKEVKKAILLMLFGGEERQQEHTRIRGDINILLVGEPGTAKSQLLRFVMNIAPLCLSTTGRGSSGVGLTAAVSIEKDSNEKSLSAGAVVLADRGIVCIDEFDKMNSNDRVAMHEAMEQGSVTIAKAGIHATLNARCTVFAAANPVYGFYVPNQGSKNIGLPESLLSRFDLVFIVLDEKDIEHHKNVAGHVLENHGPDRSQAAEQAGNMLEEEIELIEEEAEGTRKVPVTERFGKTKVVTIDFLRRYIQLAKAVIHPVLTEQARNEIIDAYTELRTKSKNLDMRITPRSLENLIRLSTAHARMRLSQEVEKVDVAAAVKLVRHALSIFEKPEEERKRKREDHDAQSGKKKPVAEPAPGAPTQRGATVTEPLEEPEASAATAATTESPAVQEEEWSDRQVAIRDHISAILRRADMIQLFALRDEVNKRIKQQPGSTAATTAEIQTVVQRLHNSEAIMFADGVVYRV
eukprot:TRINITY_DN3553_c0_g1_i1.p1 TRINITY_DN3553_c0_g1~~TRINITY_DN3553_c0_g1_i1.p1  ORF type:complete len:782 (+),score=139.80 TRINITY_DN3553_c0_g1_i1:118-2463(+)